MNQGDREYQPGRVNGTAGSIFLLFCSGYIALLWAFAGLDLYHSGFDTRGLAVPFYNGLRLIFVAYLFWVLYATGDLLLAVLSRGSFRGRSILDRLALGFFSGVGVWQIVLLGLGLANLLQRDLVIVLTSVVLVFSFSSFASTVFCPSIISRKPFNFPVWMRETGFVLLALLAGSMVLLTIVKGLYPAGGHDYYTHYFHYYRDVVESGGVWPNNIWYHFYYSKGAGLFFLGMLLTDPLAPQLITLCMFAGGGISLAAFMSHIGIPVRWRVAFLTLVFAAYVYTPGPRENMLHGGWGDFEKLHEPQTMLAAFLIYALYRLMSREGVKDSSCRIAAMLAVAAAVILTPPTAAFYAPAILLLFGIAWIKGLRNAASGYASVLFVCLASAIGLLALNYFVTGFPSDQGMRFFWKFADFEKVQEWGVLPHFVVIYDLITSNSGDELPVFGWKAFRFLMSSFRLDLFGAAILLCVPWFALRMMLGHALACDAERCRAAFMVLLCFFVVGCLTALLFGRGQAISFYRFSSFLIPITICLVAAAWAYVLPLSNSNEGRVAAAIPVAMVVVCALVAVRGIYDFRKASDVVRQAAVFLIGGHSLSSAYATQISWPGRLPWGGIYPAARTAHGMLPVGERLWSLNIHAYCMAPDCRVESYQSYKLGADWNNTFFGTPEQSRLSLQAGNLNYFLISPNLAIPDPLALSPLLHPDAIAENFGVVWMDGNTALLTWKNRKTKDLPKAWVESYRERVASSRLHESFPYELLKSVLGRLDKSGDYNQMRTLGWHKKSSGILDPAEPIRN